ncbi:30S ribosomal protein S16 [Candidatus Daviesbacteria bacterium]|nr:30S ribosomal protein S16 [Candidatus Daviesbacteria bacterium]
MIKIRLMRIGAKQKPFYRIVVVDERSKRNGAYIELLGTYNPLTNPHDIKLNKDRVDHWLKQGAQKSDGFLRMLGEAPQKPPRKPKREKKAEEPKLEPKVEEAKAEETPAEPEPKVKKVPIETSAEQPQAEEKPAEVAQVEKSEKEQKNERSA